MKSITVVWLVVVILIIGFCKPLSYAQKPSSISQIMVEVASVESQGPALLKTLGAEDMFAGKSKKAVLQPIQKNIQAILDPLIRSKKVIVLNYIKFIARDGEKTACSIEEKTKKFKVEVTPVRESNDFVKAIINISQEIIKEIPKSNAQNLQTTLRAKLNETVVLGGLKSTEETGTNLTKETVKKVNLMLFRVSSLL